MGKSQERDPFAPWRACTEFTLDQAAHLCAGVVPGSLSGRLRDRDKAEREEAAAVHGWLGRLKESADVMGVSIVRHPERYRYSTDVDGLRRVLSSSPARVEYGKVQREALVCWLDSIGQRPSFFFPDSRERTATAKAVGETERASMMALLGCLAELAGFDLRGDEQMYGAHPPLLPELEEREAPLDKGTVAKYLREARTHIKAIGPPPFTWLSAARESGEVQGGRRR